VWIMAALFKYLATVAVIVSAVIVSAIFLGFAAMIETSATTTPAWKLDRLKADPDTPYISGKALSPIYPAAPGKELLGTPIRTVVGVTKHYEVASAKPFVQPVKAKHLDVSQALQLHKLPHQIYAAGENDRNYSQQSSGHAEEPQVHSRMLSIIPHGLY
jgi:hypothetical protein